MSVGRGKSDQLSINRLFGLEHQTTIHRGFDDELLEKLCEPSAGGLDFNLASRKSPHLYWTVEHYSLGWCYRKLLSWPRWMPLPLYGDHGVALAGSLQDHEKSAKPRSHITWNQIRADALRSDGERVIEAPHPWVYYRRRTGIEKSSSASGTLIFIPHTIERLDFAPFDWERMIQGLCSNPQLSGPFVLCIHRHDIAKLLHKRFRASGLPIVSAGDPGSNYFVDRFYAIVREFEFATSPAPGSELFYCQELGVDFLITGEVPMRISSGRRDLPDGPLSALDDTASRDLELQRRIFSSISPEVYEKKVAYVEARLGLGIDAMEARKVLRREALVELVRHFPWLLKLLIMKILRKCKSLRARR